MQRSISVSCLRRPAIVERAVTSWMAVLGTDVCWRAVHMVEAMAWKVRVVSLPPFGGSVSEDG